MGVTGLARRLVLSLRALCVVSLVCGIQLACANGSEPYSVVALNGEPDPEIALPVLSGDLEHVVEQICGWAGENQIAFGPEVIERVYVEHMMGPDGGRYVPWSLASVFLESNQNPQQLALQIDPTVHATPRRGRELVYLKIDHPGLWVLTKGPVESCSTSGSTFVLARDDRSQLCVGVASPDVVPEDILTRADYRDLYYRIRGGAVLHHQMLQIRILTLRSGDAVVGRSINAGFYASPDNVGGVSYNCLPSPNPLAFESPE